VLNKPLKLRKAWVINPAVRIKKSKRAYSRQKAKLQLKRIIDEKE
jgi:hypothetical protein